jgi:hypothetical protein
VCARITAITRVLYQPFVDPYRRCGPRPPRANAVRPYRRLGNDHELVSSRSQAPAWESLSSGPCPDISQGCVKALWRRSLPISVPRLEPGNEKKPGATVLAKILGRCRRPRRECRANPDWWDRRLRLSQKYGPRDFVGRGASRSALISGGSRTAPTHHVRESGVSSVVSRH